MGWFNSKSYPDFWDNYCSHFKTPQEQNLKSIRFVVFDTETTGLDVRSDRILSIGCIAIRDLTIKVSDQLESYVQQDLFNSNTVKIHGLLRGGAINKISEQEALKSFLDYIGNAVLVAHHAAFDIAMINAGLKRLGLPKLKNKVLDTGQLYLKTEIDKSKSHISLDDLAKRFKISLHDRHTASGDAYITALIFLKLVTSLTAKKPLKLREISQNQNRIGLL